MRPFAPLRRLSRVWDYLLGNAAVRRPARRLGVEALEDRTLLSGTPTIVWDGEAGTDRWADAMTR